MKFIYITHDIWMDNRTLVRCAVALLRVSCISIDRGCQSHISEILLISLVHCFYARLSVPWSHDKVTKNMSVLCRRPLFPVTFTLTAAAVATRAQRCRILNSSQRHRLRWMFPFSAWISALLSRKEKPCPAPQGWTWKLKQKQTNKRGVAFSLLWHDKSHKWWIHNDGRRRQQEDVMNVLPRARIHGHNALNICAEIYINSCTSRSFKSVIKLDKKRYATLKRNVNIHLRQKCYFFIFRWIVVHWTCKHSIFFPPYMRVYW